MKLKLFLAAALAALTLSQVACADSNANASVKEGKDYSVIEGKEGSKKPQVIEFFSYTCPHCYNMEGFLHKWLPNKPSNVEFKQVPVFMAQLPHLTYGYYTAEVLGVLDNVHMAILASGINKSASLKIKKT